MKKVRVAIMGYGHLGKWHTQKANQLESSELVAVVEPSKAHQESARSEYPSIKVVENIEGIMDEIDAAIVVTPTSIHYDCVQKLLNANKHVFCEKPLCSTFEQTKNLASLIGDNILQVGHSERCHQAWELIDTKLKALAGPKTVKINRFAPFKGRATDVDVVQDLMIHDIDLIHYLFGAILKSVETVGQKIRTDHWDHVTAIFTTTDNDKIIITSGRNHVFEERSFEVMSTAGSLYVDLFRNKIHEGTSTEFSSGEFVKTTDYEKRDHLLVEQEKFYDSILNGKDIFVDYTAGKNAVLVVDKTLESLASGKVTPIIYE